MGDAGGIFDGVAVVVGDGQEFVPWVSGIRESEELPYALKPLGERRAVFLLYGKKEQMQRGICNYSFAIYE